MKAKWLWITWAYAGLTLVIALQFFLLVFAMVKLVPAYNAFHDRQLLEASAPGAQAIVGESHAWLMRMVWLANHFAAYWWLWTSAVAALWGWFELRARSDNKSFMRLGALGIAAFALTVFVAITTGGMLIPFVIAVPTLNAREPEPIVRSALTSFDASVLAMEQSIDRQDWPAARQHGGDAQRAMSRLNSMGATAPTMLSLSQQPKLDELRLELASVYDALRKVNDVLDAQDTQHVHVTMQKFHHSYNQARQAGL